jgi:hypothetical protein
MRKCLHRFRRYIPRRLRASGRGRLRDERGQSVVEYILVLFLVVSSFILIMGKLKKDQFFFKKFTEPMVKHITYNYKYGDPRAQGWDESSPRLHIQISRPNDGQTFRLFQPDK